LPAWADCPQLPVIEGTVIRLEVDRLPSGAIPKPVWLWSLPAPYQQPRHVSATVEQRLVNGLQRRWSRTAPQTGPSAGDNL
jgi:hypothetical protein